MKLLIKILFMLHTPHLFADNCSIVTPPYYKANANYNEDKVPAYTLPPLLINNGGSPVLNATDWRKRRLEILNLFTQEVYGSVPSNNIQVSYTKSPAPISLPPSFQAQAQEVSMHFSKNGVILKSIPFLMIIPKTAQVKPVPALLFINFSSNVEMINTWATEDAVKSGQAIIYVQYTDIEPDSHTDFKFSSGIRKLFLSQNQTALKENEWGAISAWAFGTSRILDYLITSESRIDSQKVAVAGHSRLGKTALWAAAQDERFAMAISNNSGAVGAALNKRIFGETVQAINYNFPHWFNCNFKKYNEAEENLPVDQHMLIALIAPRPVYVASATEDRWADPKGEFLSLKKADEVYRLLGVKGIDENLENINVDISVGNLLRYHIRSGAHQVTPFDWTEYLKFMKSHLGN